MLYLLCLSLDAAEISQKVTTGKLLLMVVKEQIRHTYLLFTFLQEDLLKVLKQENAHCIVHLIVYDESRTSDGYHKFEIRMHATKFEHTYN